MQIVVAGNVLTHQLADFGAEVIKVERLSAGGNIRRLKSR